MPTCPFGWWRNTTPMWISAMCGRGLRSRCRGSRRSIGSDVPARHVPVQQRAEVFVGAEINDGIILRMDVKCDLAAGGHPPEHFDREIEVRSLPPRNHRLVCVAAKSRRRDRRKDDRPIIENQSDGARHMDIAGLLVASGRNVYPQA